MSFYKPKPKRKAENERWHAKRRIFERYGIRLNRTEYRRIINVIRGASDPEIDAQFLYRESNRVTHHLVTYHGIPMHLCYDKERQELITALTIKEKAIAQAYGEPDERPDIYQRG